MQKEVKIFTLSYIPFVTTIQIIKYSRRLASHVCCQSIGINFSEKMHCVMAVRQTVTIMKVATSVIACSYFSHFFSSSYWPIFHMSWFLKSRTFIIRYSWLGLAATSCLWLVFIIHMHLCDIERKFNRPNERCSIAINIWTD